MDKNAFQGIIGTGKIDNEKVILAKPQTYMNLSGECVSEILKFYKVPSENLIVVYDDIDIKLGKIKIRPSGSAGTHNGMRNIISLINSENFVRVRVGTDKPQQGIDLADYVLMKLKTEEKTIIEKIYEYSLEELMETGFGRYAKEIIQERALPDVRDGLKPVQRRILYAMYISGFTHNKPYRKSARIVGDTMGK